MELISPANKDRPAARQAFAVKCASYLHQGIGLVIIDVVTSRNANLHNDLMALMPQSPTSELPAPADLYAVAYHPLRRKEHDEIDVWAHSLSVGKTLPELPLWLGPDLVVPLNLEASYSSACRRRRLTN